MNKALLILTLTTFGGASAAAWFHLQLQTERHRNAELQARIEAQQPPLAHHPFTTVPETLPVRVDVGESAQAPPATVPSVRRDPESPQPNAISPERSAQIRQRFANEQRELLRDPEYRQAMRTQQRFSLQQIHPDLARELDIPQERADRLLDLLIDQRLRNMEQQAAFPADRPPTEAEVMQMQKNLQQRQLAERAEIAALLGGDSQQQWQDYENSMGARMRVRQLSTVLDGAGIPLREDQRPPLRDTLAQYERQAQQDRQTQVTTRDFANMTLADRLAWQEEQIELTEQSYARARESVSHILTTQQLDAYRELQEQELAVRRANLRMERARMATQGDDPAAGIVVSSGSVPGRALTPSGPVVVTE